MKKLIRNKQPKMMPIIGKAREEITPEKCSFNILYKTPPEDNSRIALTKAIKKREEMLELIKDALPLAEIKDKRINVHELYNKREKIKGKQADRTIDYETVLIGYEASIQLTITGAVHTASENYLYLSTMDLTKIESPIFFLTPETLERKRLELQKKAIENSREIAEELASAAGLIVKGIKYLGEELARDVFPRTGSSVFLAKDASGYEEDEEKILSLSEISPEDIVIEESLAVSYYVVNKLNSNSS